MSTWRWAFVALAPAILGGCSTSLHGQLDDVEQKIRDESARLDAIHREALASELRADEARRRADFQECRATAASIKADMTVQVAQCLEEKAKFSECGARNSQHTAEFGVGGCLLGIGFAALTAGAGAGAALAGCGGGLLAGNETTQSCAQVSCSEEPSVALTSALASHHLARFPLCGGVLRVVLGSQPSQVPQITAVEPGGPAALAGILPGDTIVNIAGAQVSTIADLLRVLGDHPPGEVVDAVCARAASVCGVAVRLAEHP